MSVRSLLCLFGMVAALSACGGRGEPAAPTPSPTPSPSPSPTPAGGLYVGYYQEDPATNPEDPMPGAYSLNLPDGNSSFSGSMYFTYVGCQSSNVGAVSGTKSGLSLSGNWSGTVDGTAQSGSYSGTYDTVTQSYSGTYTVAGGKQFMDLRPCIQYSIAPNGTWEMFPVDSHVPASFGVSVNGRTISWTATSGAAFTLVYVLDPAIAQSTGNPVLWQTVVGADTSVGVPTEVALSAGKQYIAAVGVSNSSRQRAAFGSQRFTP